MNMMNMRTDPTTGTRLVKAIRRMTPLAHHMSSLIEQFLRKEDIDAESLKQAARASYVKACEIVADAGLEIRQRALKYTVTNVPGRDAGLMIDGEFALAGPLDGPEAALAWERRAYIGFDAEASEEVLLDEARRYWLSDKLMLPTEADALPTAGIEGGPTPGPTPRGDDPAAPTRG